ncbi:protein DETOXIFICATION 17 isoform X2 [Selaginella moellendorffii]|uniref:protein DETOXIFICATION 17 isoform X2 n=1 Tax=Selaginella moellendorffii TaxID=88036 RepID=UPI000D1C9137|nr:protein DETOXIFICATION 17 isoform X2 [Selaginella moellendorffii]|eukprot:XP_024536814.1 protein DETOXIFICATION 17 isoform X2 [Selaginella moellendorffii]
MDNLPPGGIQRRAHRRPARLHHVRRSPRNSGALQRRHRHFSLQRLGFQPRDRPRLCSRHSVRPSPWSQAVSQGRRLHPASGARSRSHLYPSVAALDQLGAFASLVPPGSGDFRRSSEFFQTQSRVLPLFWSSILALLCHILLCWIFTYKLGMGNAGAAVSLSITYWLLVFFLVTAAAASPTFANYWHGFTTEAFHGISQFLKLAIPSALMVCLEWWAFEVLILFSGVLPNPALQTSVLSIVMGIINLWMIPSYGISAATSVRTSNELGAGNPLVARFAFRVAVLICLVYATLAMLVLLLSRNVVGHAFSSDSQVVSYVGRMIPFASGFVILSALHSVGYGVASGCGWQSIAALGNIGAYYVVGLPLSYVLGFVFHLRVEGLLSGSLLGFLVQALVFFVAAFSTNWEKRALQARDRLGLSAPLLEDQI